MKDNKAEIMYQSEGKTPNGDPFITVKKARNYYEYSERGGVDSICFVLYDSKTKKFALIKEAKPPRDEIEDTEVQMTTAFGGSIDMGKNTTYQEICQTEVLEEAGFEVPLANITSVGKTLVSSQMSQMCMAYLVDVTGVEKTHKAEYELEASEAQNEKDANEFYGNEVIWMDINEVMENGDWKSIYIMSRSFFKRVVTY